jgi:hypothetical protein
MYTLIPLLTLLLGCGLDPAKIASHRLFVADGTEFVAQAPIQFAVVGNTRGMHPALDRGRLGHGEVSHQLVGDLIASTITGGPDFAILAGDVVRNSSTSEWADFDDRFIGLLDGASPAMARNQRIPVVAIAGDRDGAGDTSYTGLSAAFPGTGASIGHGRNATWSSFDIQHNQARWRFLMLDSNKDTLGSRWREQLNWIPSAVEGRTTGIIVIIHDPAFSLGGKSQGSPHTQELLELLDRTAPMDSIKAVISAGPSVSQALLPGGALGVLHIGAGGGGAPAEDLHRAAAQGGTLTLASGFDKALLAQLSTWRAPDPLEPATIDRARSSGEYSDIPGVYDAGAYPTYGWWLGQIEGERLSLSWRRWQPDGTFKTVWKISHTRATGWADGAH